ncbi:MAG TPA: GDP-mannose 4,6-dehydratase [Bacteroidales bacterium]
MSNILITGGAGFIGSSLTDSLLLQDYKVLCLDNFDSFYDKKIKLKNIEKASQNPNFKLIEGDIRNKDLLVKIFEKNDIHLIAHLAAKAGVRPSVESPQEYFEVNINGTINILEVAKDFGVKKMVFASSSSVYGNNTKIPFSELDFVDHPISPYAASKKAGELICFTYHELYKMDINCLRFFTVYGPRQRPDLAIHKFARLILEDKPVPVYGDGSFKRDFTYVDDTVFGINQAIKNLNGFHVYNLGNSRTISVLEMVSELEKSLGKKAQIDFRPLQPGDVKLTFADISSAKKELHYNPKFDFSTGISNFVDWLKTN